MSEDFGRCVKFTLMAHAHQDLHFTNPRRSKWLLHWVRNVRVVYAHVLVWLKTLQRSSGDEECDTINHCTIATCILRAKQIIIMICGYIMLFGCQLIAGPVNCSAIRLAEQTLHSIDKKQFPTTAGFLDQIRLWLIADFPYFATNYNLCRTLSPWTAS